MRALVVHLTTPSSSEAKVLAALLAHLDAQITCTLWLNGPHSVELADSAFRGLGDGSVTIQAVETGLPIDPWVPRRLVSRLRFRAVHSLRRMQLVRRAASLRPDVVYTSQQRFDCFLGELISRTLRIPHVVHLHFTPGPELRPRTLKRLRTCDLVIAVSSFIRDRAVDHGVRRDRIVVLPNSLGYALPNLANDDVRADGRLVIGQTGRMEKNKGFADSVAAFAIVHARNPATELVLIGDGSDRERVERIAQQRNVHGAVRFTGWQHDALSFLRHLDVFIHPSRDEPFGLAVLEASGIGLPVVAYDDGGLTEVVVNGETGLLTPVGDIDALANALDKLLADPGLRASMGRAGRERVTRWFRPEDAGRRFSRALQDVVVRRRTSASG